MATISAQPQSSGQKPQQSGYIVSPWYDLLFFILSPLLALVLGIAINGNVVAQRSFMLGGYSNTIAGCFIGTFIMAHLFIVFFRSHLNQQIFTAYRWRFTLVPLVLFISMCLSTWVAVSVSVLATWWDVYHSSLQTFGIGRIYDMRAGNDAARGRRLDWWLNILLYAGPILAGATLVQHIQDFEEYREVGSVFFASIPAFVQSNQRFLTWGVIGVGVPFLAYYVYAYWQLHRQGYAISPQKVTLVVTTGLVSIFTWGFNTFGEAFFIMNFFHAWQYFAIVWWSEKKNLQKRTHLQNKSWGQPLLLLLFLAIAFGYGFWAETAESRRNIFFNLIMVVSIMHFWYDGFIWSVRKKQV